MHESTSIALVDRTDFLPMRINNVGKDEDGRSDAAYGDFGSPPHSERVGVTILTGRLETSSARQLVLRM
jgi:hypothetical protein